MANPEHIEILRQGVEFWNNWREQNPNIIPDLSRADLRHNDYDTINFKKSALSHVNLEFVNLTDAKLNGADLTDANLSHSDLQYSDFSNATLQGTFLIESSINHTKFIKADLTDANLCNSNLSFSDLTSSTLFYADLSRVEFFDTRISKATVGFTVFADTDIWKVIGLETINHLGPSSISISSLILSKGRIPEIFLRRAGVPDSIIKYVLSLSEQDLEYHSCFISHSSKDKDFVERLHSGLQSKGVRCWCSPEDLKIGDKIRQSMDQSIRIQDKLLLVLSQSSIESEWVADEVESAYEQERKRGKTVLVPIRLDSAVMDTDKAWATKLRSRHIGDFTNWKNHGAYQKAFERLQKDLKAKS